MLAAQKFFGEILLTLRHQNPEKPNAATEAPWIARFLLFFMTVPMTNERCLEDAREVWDRYITGGRYVNTRGIMYKVL